MTGTHVLVLAKSPVAGRVKTRLTPELSPQQAADLAEASLADTLEAVRRCGAERRVLALDGDPGPWLPDGFEVIAQRGDGLAERLACAWDDVGGPGLQVGMDTPQVTAELLDASLAQLDQPSVDAVLGLAEDGGWWAIGLLRPDPIIFRGVPMSSRHTGRRQRERLLQLGLRVDALPVLRDVDTVADLGPVGAAAPSSRFAAACAALGYSSLGVGA